MGQSEKPQIIPLPNGPYYYFTKFETKPVDGITNSDIKPPLLVVDPERFYRSGEK